MVKSVQILFLIALFPLLGQAREETMEARRQRIMRKYLHDRASVSESGFAVPEFEENERVIASEKLQGADIGIEREERVTPVPPPPRAKPAAKPSDRNWMLSDDEADNFLKDPYADPFAVKEEEPTKKKEDLWKQWGYGEKQDRESSGRRQNTYSSQYGNQDSERRSGLFSERFGSSERRGVYSTDSSRQEYSSGYKRTDIFGRQQPSTYQQPTEGSGYPQTRTYGSSPDSGLLTTPYSQDRFSSGSDERERERQGAFGNTPYKSSLPSDPRSRYSTQTGGSRNETQTEYQKTDPFKDWKQREYNQKWKGDDAFVNEMLEMDRR